MPEPTKYSVEVSVTPSFLAAQSQPDADRYVFAYTVTIRNTGSVAAKLLTRHWIITDGDGEEREVEGEGVVGEQPRLEPGEDYTYTSGAVIATPIGSMRGNYRMLADDGRNFDARIAAFTLAVPRTLH